jgi:hypothetical protein
MRQFKILEDKYGFSFIQGHLPLESKRATKKRTISVGFSSTPGTWYVIRPHGPGWNGLLWSRIRRDIITDWELILIDMDDKVAMFYRMIAQHMLATRGRLYNGISTDKGTDGSPGKTA